MTCRIERCLSFDSESDSASSELGLEVSSEPDPDAPVWTQSTSATSASDPPSQDWTNGKIGQGSE